MPAGIILFAHGARDPRWAEPFEAIAARVRALRPDAAVRLAFLEFMSPALAPAADELVAAGCLRVEILPLFLGAGGHVRRDLPVLVDAQRARHPGTRWTLHMAVGETGPVMDAIAAGAAATLPPAP